MNRKIFWIGFMRNWMVTDIRIRRIWKLIWIGIMIGLLG